MDPYCRCSVGSKTVMSQVCESGGKEPRWNETLEMPLRPGFTTLSVVVLDRNTLSADRTIATCDADLTGLLAGEAPREKAYPLNGQLGEGREGTLHMHLQFRPFVPAPPAPAFMPMAVMPMPGMPPVPMPMPYGGMYAPGMPGPNPYGAPAPIPAHALRGFTDEDVTALHDMFPNIGRDVVESVLAVRGGNKDAAINDLLAL